MYTYYSVPKQYCTHDMEWSSNSRDCYCHSGCPTEDLNVVTMELSTKGAAALLLLSAGIEPEWLNPNADVA